MNSRKLNDTQVGILLVIVGLGFAAITAALMKYLSQDLNAYQIAWFRFLGFTLIIFAVVVKRIGISAIKPARPAMQVMRGLTMSSATVCFVLGARSIDLADAIAILYAYPFILTVFAVVFLKEQVNWSGWIGVIGGFVGVLLVMRPDFNQLNIGALFVFLCAVIIGVQMAINRKLGSLSPPLVTALWGGIIATLSLTLILPFFWQSITWPQLLLLCLMSITGSVNQTCLVYAFAKAEASILAPFTYFEIIAAILLGAIFFDTLPVWLTWLGIILIIGSGVLVARASVKR